MIFSKLANKIRISKNKHKEPYSSLYNILGFYPDNVDLYEQAFIHSSISSSLPEGQRYNNERLEFLGDAILEAIIADIVYEHYPNKREGFLTSTRSKIVQRDSMNTIALRLGIDKKVTSMPYAAAHHKFMFGNALEALIGAIYLDQGYNVCRKFVKEKMIANNISLDRVANQEMNFKSRLLEWGQKSKLNITFDLIGTFINEDSATVFQTSVSIEGAPIATGVGNTKKESQQLAAKTVINKIQNDKNTQKLIINLKSKMGNGEYIDTINN
ncbi:MAG: ribonuclease III [Tannerella sp.]|nr:ribonuclease III [Tannerella sp.]